MHELKGKLPFLFLIALLVIIILISNLGHNFKTDVFSYNNTISISNNLSNKWNNAEQNKEYIISSSEYIISFLKSNNIEPLLGNSYVDEWPIQAPYYKFPSNLEVVSTYGRTIKKYTHGKDFVEDFRGHYSPGIIKDRADYYDDSISLEDSSLRKIILTDEYHNKSTDAILSLDLNLKHNGADAIISPSHSEDLLYESGIYDSNIKNNENGLIKFIVSSTIFTELKQFSQRGYTIRLKAGTEINTYQNRNVYGILRGKNNTYKPLVIACFYDSTYKIGKSIDSNFLNYTLTPSVLMESIRGIQTQRLNKPDRSIIFVFLSGYPNNKEGLNEFFKTKIDGDVVFLDNLGISYKNILSYSRSNKNLSMTVEHFAKENNFEIISKNINSEPDTNYVQISSLNNEENSSADFQYLYSSYKFLLSLIGDECYNLDFLSGNVRELRTFKRFVRTHSTSLSLLTLFLLIIIIFRKNE
jgi:hypothetical protein